MKNRFAVTVVWFLGLAFAAQAMRGDDDAAHRIIPGGGRTQYRRAELSGPQRAALRAARNEGVDAQIRPGWASRISIRGRQLGRRRIYSGGRGIPQGKTGDHAKNALAVLDNLSPLIGVRHAGEEFKARTINGDTLGYHHVRMKQLHKGLRVVGGDLIVHFNEADEAYQVNGSYVPGIGIDPTPVLSPDAALEIASDDLAGMKRGEGEPAAEPELVIYARRRAPTLAYEVLLSSPPAKDRAMGAWKYWIDALSGEVIMRLDTVKDIAAPTANGSNANITGTILTGEGGGTSSVIGWEDFSNSAYYLYNKDLKWYIYNDTTESGLYSDANTYAHRLTGDWDYEDDSDPVEMSAAVNFDATQDYFKNVHGRSSYDNGNAYARANVHYGYSYNNAYWSPYSRAFYFGDGNGSRSDPLVVLDVVGHEFTHAVTEYSANLNYAYESGALNESFSDIFGTCIEFAAQPNGSGMYPSTSPGWADWLLAEDCWRDAYAMRDMRNPRNTSVVGIGNEQPSRYFGEYWYTGDGDNGGVHVNSGVQNFFFYLLCEGGSGDNDGISYDITGIGMSNAEEVAYRALTVYCTMFTDYRDVRGAWIDAASDLNPAWVATVEAAWEACGVGPMDIQPRNRVEFEGSQGGIFQPWRQVYTIINESSASVSWTIDTLPSWLQASPGSGTLAAGASQEIQLTLTSAADSLFEGIHEASLTLRKTSGTLIGSRQVLLRVGDLDYFSEQFGYSDGFDLDGLSLTFTPDMSISGYTADAIPIDALPTDPTAHSSLSLYDDDYVILALTDNKKVLLYGSTYNYVYINSNGHITFHDGDRDLSESFEDHFSEPRISTFFDDLNPSSGGFVKWEQLPNRAVVTFINVPEYSSTGANTFQTEMFFDGRIRLSWLGITATDGLAGLSDGSGIPDYFRESDLSGFGWDYDGDGLPNWWEEQYFTGETNCIAGEDSDNDGQVNMDEYVAGTDPVDSGSFFHVDCSVAEDAASPSFVLRWDPLEGREYRIWKRNNLFFNTPEMIQSGVTYPVNCYTVTTEHAESCFYELQVEMIE